MEHGRVELFCVVSGMGDLLVAPTHDCFMRIDAGQPTIKE
jgi:hypothetical protein